MHGSSRLTNLDKVARWNRRISRERWRKLSDAKHWGEIKNEPDLSDDALLRNEFFLKVITDAIKEETDLSVRYLTE